MAYYEDAVERILQVKNTEVYSNVRCNANKRWTKASIEGS
jgi:hypothetical protein